MAGMFGDDGDSYERLSLLPHPRGMLASEGRGSVASPGVDWTDWIAPQWVASLSQAVQSPRAAYQGADVDERDALNVALNVMGGGMLTGRGASGLGANAPFRYKRNSITYELGNPEYADRLARSVNEMYDFELPRVIELIKAQPAYMQSRDSVYKLLRALESEKALRDRVAAEKAASLNKGK